MKHISGRRKKCLQTVVESWDKKQVQSSNLKSKFGKFQKAPQTMFSTVSSTPDAGNRSSMKQLNIPSVNFPLSASCIENIIEFDHNYCFQRTVLRTHD